MKLENYFLSTRPRHHENLHGYSKTVVTSGTDDTSVMTEDLLNDDNHEAKNQKEKDGFSFLSSMFTVETKKNANERNCIKRRKVKHKSKDALTSTNFHNKSKKNNMHETSVAYTDFCHVYDDFCHVYDDIADMIGESMTNGKKKRRNSAKNSSIETAKNEVKLNTRRSQTIEYDNDLEKSSEIHETKIHECEDDLFQDNTFLREIALHPLLEFSFEPLTDYPFDESQENKHKCDIFPEHQFTVLTRDNFQNSDIQFPYETFPHPDFSSQFVPELEKDNHFENDIFEQNDIFGEDATSDYRCSSCQKLAVGSIGQDHVSYVCGRSNDRIHSCYVQLQPKFPTQTISRQ